MVKDRLYPEKGSGRYYILTLLRIVNEIVVSNCVSDDSVIVDFGCGNMPYKRIFEKQCKSYIGVDFVENKNADLHINNGKIPMEDRSVDIVVSTQVLEHVEHPDLYLKECYRVLKKGGKLLLSTHGHWKYHPDPTDFWRWTKDGLHKIINKEQFEIETTYGLMGLASSGLQLFQDGFESRVHYRLRSTFYKLIAWSQEKLDKRQLYQQDASVFYVIARK